ncbi:uncharacterized protein LOC134764726 [Penaeus indicus]|uniref:uncharacterized protein LOC134764726 n=1 Tax=Penaeus indicus TaxID=29960 RepID=UPI00300C1626
MATKLSRPMSASDAAYIRQRAPAAASLFRRRAAMAKDSNDAGQGKAPRMSKRVLRQAEQVGRQIDEKREAVKEAVEELEAKARRLRELAASLKPAAKRAVGRLRQRGASASGAAASPLRPAVARRRARRESFKLHLSRLAKDVDPAFGVTRGGLDALDGVTCELLERLAGGAAGLTKVGRRVTLGERDAEAAVRLLLRGRLRREGERAARAAVGRFRAWR